MEEYEKVLEKRKALLPLKAEERKVEVGKELRSMQQLSVKKDSDKVFIKLVGSCCAFISYRVAELMLLLPVYLVCCRVLTRRKGKEILKETSVPRRYVHYVPKLQVKHQRMVLTSIFYS